MIVNEKLYEYYGILNKKYFNGKLPANVIVEWSNRLTSCAGKCYTTKKGQTVIKQVIRLSTHYHFKYPDEIESTLIHEMIHLVVSSHGTRFKEELIRIQNMGGKVSRYSKERAKTKEPSWIYICQSCGKIYFRYRRGAKHYRCGICQGIFIEKPIKITGPNGQYEIMG